MPDRALMAGQRNNSTPTQLSELGACWSDWHSMGDSEVAVWPKSLPKHGWPLKKAAFPRSLWTVREERFLFPTLVPTVATVWSLCFIFLRGEACRFCLLSESRKASPAAIRECLNLEEIAEKWSWARDQSSWFCHISLLAPSAYYGIECFLFSAWEKLLWLQ